MPIPRIVQTNFTAGEFSPILFGRTDLERYLNACERIENFLVRVQGGVTKRPGTRFVGETRDSTVKPRLLEFEFSVDQAYTLEFGNVSVRFFRDRAQLTKDHTVTGASWAAGTATVTIGTHTILVGTSVTVADVDPTGYNGTYTVTAVTATTIDYAIASDPGAWSSGGTVTADYEITSPYSEAQLAEVKYAQSADVMFLCHPDVKPRELQRLGDTNWQFVEFDFNDGPFMAVNATATTLTLSGGSYTTGDTVTVTANVLTGINDDTGFQSTDVGRQIRWKDPAGNWTWLTITVHTDTLNVDATIDGPDASAPTATTDWRLGAWSDTTGWPWSVTFHEGRLSFAATDTQPQTVWRSVSGDFNNFQPTQQDGTVNADDAITVTIDSDRVNAIQWQLSTDKGLVCLTVGGPYLIQDTVPTDPTQSTVPRARRQGTFGVADTVRPHLVEQSAIYTQRFNHFVRRINFDFDVDQFTGEDLTVLAEHIAKSPIKDAAFQQEPIKTLWVVLQDGEMRGMVFDVENQVVGWHRTVVGGVLSGGQAVVESVAVIPDNPYDLVWVVVKRTINGATKRYVEFIEDLFDEDLELLT